MLHTVLSFVLTVLLFCQFSTAFYLPGVAPSSYKKGEDIPLLVNHLTPQPNVLNHKESHIFAYDYYNTKFHFCQPAEIVRQPSSLGSVLFGDRIYNSPFEIKMLEDSKCNHLCTAKIPAKDSAFINQLIFEEFHQNWLVDGLPAGREIIDKDTKSVYQSSSFELGFEDTEYKDDSYYDFALFANHHEIIIDYHKRGDDEYRVVGIVVNPMSLERNVKDSCDFTGKPKILSDDEENVVSFTYSVQFRQSQTPWATRWDKYLHVNEPKIQWIYLIGLSVAIVSLISTIASVLFRTLRKDLVRYESLNLDSNEFDSDSGWKLLHGDVFRAPIRLMLLSVLVGAGLQILSMAGTVILLACFGLLSPSNRGSLSTVAIILYALFAFVGSFSSMTVYKFFNGTLWKMNLVLSSVLIPGVLFFVVSFLNLFLIFMRSSDAIPFSSLCLLVGLWILLSLPMSIAGSLIAWKKPFKETSLVYSSAPTKTNQIARQIPKQPTFLKTIPCSFAASIFPFACISVQMYFIYSSIWFNQTYYMFGFLLVAFVLLLVTTSITTMLFTYYTLCMENWKWCWKSFLIGSVGMSSYIFIHCILFTKFHLGGLTTVVLYCGYSAILSAIIGLCTGTVGFISSLLFVKKVYSSVRVD